MTNIVDIVRAKVDEGCLVSGKLTKKGCSLSLEDAPTPRLIVDFDKPDSPISQNVTRCDYLFVADGEISGWAAPIELKKGQLHASNVIKQLSAGTKVAERWIPDTNDVKFRPIAVIGFARKGDINSLKKKPIKFHNQHEAVRTIKCGGSLNTVLK